MILRQITGFTMVGGCAALVDWGMFNWFTGGQMRWHRVLASTASTSCAMAWSFAANGAFVFCPSEPAATTRMVRFLLVTCFSAWVLQSMVIWAVNSFCSGKWRPCFGSPGRIILGRFTLECVERNLGKIAAIGAGYVWNFCWYHGWVFADRAAFH